MASTPAEEGLLEMQRAEKGSDLMRLTVVGALAGPVKGPGAVPAVGESRGQKGTSTAAAVPQPVGLRPWRCYWRWPRSRLPDRLLSGHWRPSHCTSSSISVTRSACEPTIHAGHERLRTQQRCTSHAE